MHQYPDEALKPSRYAIIRWFGFDQFVPEQAVTSYWVSSRTFFAIRFICTLYSTIVIWTSLGLAAKHGGQNFFAAFTNLTFVGLHSYLVTSTVHHARFLWSKNVNFLLNQPSILNYMYIYLYSTVVTNNIVTPVVFWSILARGATAAGGLSTWLNVSVHGVSFFLMLFDVIFNRMRLPVRLIVFAILTVLLYMFLTFVIHATAGFWVYPFLNWQQGPSAAIWYFVVAILVVVAFFIMKIVHMIRDYIARKTNRIVTTENAIIIEKIEAEQQSENSNHV